MRRDPGPHRHLHVLVTALTAWVQRGCSEPNQSVCMENPSVPRRGGKRVMQEGGKGGGGTWVLNRCQLLMNGAEQGQSMLTVRGDQLLLGE